MSKTPTGGNTSKNVAPTLNDTTFTLNEGGIFSGTVLATDPDKKDVVTYSFADGTLSYVAPDGIVFTINATTGAITSSAPLNYEITSSYAFTVKATDLAGASDTGLVTIKVNDVNEVPVAFVGAGDADAGANAVLEGAAAGSLVGVTAIAFDGDGTNNVVSYQLVSDAKGSSIVAGGAFQIDAKTGIVTVSQGSLLDFETHQSETIYVRASSTDGSSVVRAFTINIADRNEYNVRFVGSGDSDATANSVAEGAQAGALVGVTAFATDADGTNHAVAYQLVSDAQGTAVLTSGAFQIDSATGVVSVRDGSLIDYESSATQTIYVQATSSDGSSDVHAFTITVQNVNEAPTGSVLVSGQRLSDVSYQLSADASGVHDPDGIVSSEYHWQQLVEGEWRTIDGKTSQNESFDASFSGAQVRSAFLYLDGSGATETVYSASKLVPNVAAILGTSGNDDVYGTALDDVIRGLSGNDTLHGGAGDDLLDGGAGHDWAIYSDALGPIDVRMAAGIVTGAGVGQDTLRSIERVEGTAFADHYDATGFDGNSANAGSDNILNVFEGMGGDDVVIGNGDTRMSYVKASAGVVVDFAAGIAYSVDINDAAHIGFDRFTGVAETRASDFADRLYGSDNTKFTEFFEGHGGGDYIDGRGGYDRAGYKDESAGIQVHLADGTVSGGDAGAGQYDTLRSVELIQGTEYADVYDARGFSAVSVNASSYGVGTTAAFNQFEGMGGDDVIYGNGQTSIAYWNADAGVRIDMIAGTATSIGPNDAAHIGNDTFSGVKFVVGSDFDDIIIGTNIGDSFQAGKGSDTIYGNGGFDFISYANEGLTSGINVRLAEGLVVSANGTDTINSIESFMGTNYADVYDARGVAPNGSYNDIEGLAGNDTILGSGWTRMYFTNAKAGVVVDFAAGTVTGDASVGSDTFSGVLQASGSSFADTLLGDGNANTLLGNAGDDVLNGRGGYDTLNGGAGADTFVFDQAGGSVIQDFTAGDGAGHDVIHFAKSVFADFDHVMAAASQSGSNVNIHTDLGDLVLYNVIVTNLTTSDFHFH